MTEHPNYELCGPCHAIWVTEGEIPTYCRHCVPPRRRPLVLAPDGTIRGDIIRQDEGATDEERAP